MTPDTSIHPAPARRETDHSRMAKLNYWFALRGFVIWTVTVIVTVVTFVVQIKELPAKVAGVEAKVTGIEESHAALLKTNEALVKLQCFNAAFTADQLWAVGLDQACNGLYQAAEARRRAGTQRGGQ